MSVVLQPTAKHTASVIFLHGLGDTGNGWSGIFASIKKPHIKYIFPTAPIKPVTLNGGFQMNAWFDIFGLTGTAPQDEKGIKESSQTVMDLVQEEIKVGIPTERIFLGGFSQGGATAFYTAMTAPHRFAGVIALSTWMPLHNHFPSKLAQCEGKMDTPILQCHGDADQVVPIGWGQQTTKHLQELGFKKSAFKKYSNLGHAYAEDELDDINDFISSNVSTEN